MASPLFELDQVVVTPHLGASTREAQDKAGITIAEQVQLALAGEFVPLAVNIAAAEVPEAVRPWLPLAERLGRFWAALARELPATLDIEFQGGLADHDTRILSLAVLKGLFGVATDEPVSYVNAPQLADERGLEVRSTAASGRGARSGYTNLVVLRGGRHAVAGTMFGDGEPRVVMVDDHDIELPLARWMLMVHNDDRIGMVAAVATILADAGCNIVDLKLGRSAAGGHGHDGPVLRAPGAGRRDRGPAGHARHPRRRRPGRRVTSGPARPSRPVARTPMRPGRHRWQLRWSSTSIPGFLSRWSPRTRCADPWRRSGPPVRAVRPSLDAADPFHTAAAGSRRRPVDPADEGPPGDPQEPDDGGCSEDEPDEFGHNGRRLPRWLSPRSAGLGWVRRGVACLPAPATAGTRLRP